MCNTPEPVQSESNLQEIADRPADRYDLLVQRFGGPIFALFVSDDRQIVERSPDQLQIANPTPDPQRLFVVRRRPIVIPPIECGRAQSIQRPGHPDVIPEFTPY